MKYIPDNIYYMAENRDAELTPLGKWIKAGLEERRRNQAWLAGKVGLQPPQISRIMRGLSEAMPDILDKIADTLGKPRIQIYRVAGHIEPAATSDEIDERILHALKQLPMEERRKWARRIEVDVDETVATRRSPKSPNKSRA